MRTVHTSELVSFSDLCSFLYLSRSVQVRAFFSWSFQFGIWCLCYNCHQLISVSRKYLKCSTTSICSSSTVTPASDCIFLIFRSLVFFTFNLSNLAFPVLLTFAISLSASSCDFAQSAVSSAYLQIRDKLSIYLDSHFLNFRLFNHRLSVYIEEMW